VTRPFVVVASDDVPAIDRGAGVQSVPLVGRWNADRNVVTTGITVIAPGSTVPLHSHNVDEFAYVLAGVAAATLGDESRTLPAGAATWVEAGTVHGFANRGHDEVRLLWAYGGRDVTRTYAATGETVDHLSIEDRVD
jgi:HTH-type transcriptional regulator, repressor for puuD